MPQSLGNCHALGLTQCDTVLTLGALHMGLLASCKLTPTKRVQLRCERHIGASTLMRLWHIWPCGACAHLTVAAAAAAALEPHVGFYVVAGLHFAD
jgi:hypothetical protein